MPPAPLVDLDSIDASRVLYDQEAIRAGNRQRFEMEQLTGILSFEREKNLIVGYKDVTDQEFWVRGHMPGFPLMPGVIMCEAAAQLCSFYCYLNQVIKRGFLGFGGLEDVRFRGVVKPGDRLVVVAKTMKIHRLQMVFETQGFVDKGMVFHARVIGVAIDDKE